MLNTIKTKAEISRLFDVGTRYQCSYLTLIVLPYSAEESKNRSSCCNVSGRVAFIAGKRLGNAVWRNNAKRRMRALCYDLGGPWLGYDVVFLAKKQLTSASYSKVIEACDALCHRFILDSKQTLEA